MKRKNRKKLNKLLAEKKKSEKFGLSEKTKRLILGILMFLLTIIIALSFFDLAGVIGTYLIKGFTFLIGKAIFVIPLLFVLEGLIFFNTKYKKFLSPTILAIFILILGISGIFGAFNLNQKQGGWLGYIFNSFLQKLFGFWVTQIIFTTLIIVGGLIFWQFFRQPPPLEEKKPLVSRIFQKIERFPKFKVKGVEPIPKPQEVKLKPQEIKMPSLELKTRPLETTLVSRTYRFPPFDLLETDREIPSSGDTRTNSAIIKKTLENFNIRVEMSEINIGPTVTQYTLKPAEGVKLSKITNLSNNLALALASHPIRIEAPIPGRSLVGIEVPNKVRAQVRLRNLIDNPDFQKSVSSLLFALGRDVSGNPAYADLSRMPHLLVAGSTGTGKTIFLNSLILSLLYRSSPEILKLILIDPKRVEFSIYNELPHLLCPVIYDPSRTVNALHWLTSEMERRFDVLSEFKARDIESYNRMIKEKSELMPYIILIIDELADLMAAKGREVEAGIVRLAQMSRAVGIHLVVATQRPSVEVITGLIKANITSRTTFQVASQVDSRTVLDMAGAEKLLGLGDMLYVSAEIVKPRRIQGAYVSEKEVKKVVNWIKKESEKLEIGEEMKEELTQDLEKDLKASGREFLHGLEDPLYEEAKRVVVEARKASASLLQRRLRIGYARAARLIDMLEEKGVVGPGEGAKPRKVYLE
ncbi:DNA translocase FtsK 4TM domain-containing protein [Patescibacteria group bacterium]|nr:DNA translocase FtsK 4TM domain-containing protein [Patescibacteria group bacterium]